VLQHGVRCWNSPTRLKGRIQALGSWKIRADEHARSVFRLTLKVAGTLHAQDSVRLLES